MTMRLFAPPSVRVGDNFVVHVHADDPGNVALQYVGPVAGPSSTTIPGARQYRYGGNPAGQYAARVLSTGQGQDRSPASWLIRLRPEDLAGACAYQSQMAFSATYYGVPLLWCAKPAPGASLTARVNWMVSSFWAHGVVANSLRVTYPLWASPSPATNPSQYSPTGVEYGDNEQYATACVLTVADGTLTRHMRGPTGAVQTHAAACSLSGTMGGTEVICAQWPFEQFLKYDRAVTAQEAADWLLYGTIPSDPQIAYLGGHEIDGPQRVYDSGPMGLHLGEADMSIYPGNGFGPPSCAHRYVEAAPVQPVAVTMTATGPGTATIVARRTRVGVPASATDAERYEYAAADVVVMPSVVYIGPDVSVDPQSPTATLHVVAAPDTTVALTATPGVALSHAIVETPATVVARVHAYGAHTVTASDGSATASCTVTMAPAQSAATRDVVGAIVAVLRVIAPTWHYDDLQDQDRPDMIPGTYTAYVQSRDPGPIVGGWTHHVSIAAYGVQDAAHTVASALEAAMWPSWVAAMRAVSVVTDVDDVTVISVDVVEV